MITAQEMIELLKMCDPRALVRIAIPGDNYSENVSFVDYCTTGNEIHLCNDKPDWIGDEDWRITVLAESENFAKTTVEPRVEVGNL
jgi:hypothetical protein